MDGEKLWQATLADLEVSLSVSTFKTWFSQTKLQSIEKVDNNHQLVTINCPSSYAKEWIETHYQSQVQQIIEKISNTPSNITFVVGHKVPTATTEAGPLFEEVDKDIDPDALRRKAQLNPTYTFNNFIVGASNNLAYNAAQAVVAASGRVHNPFFIYGGVGCGKTHLMMAVGNAILAKSPQSHVLYASCEQFTNDLIESLKLKNTEKFRNKYRKLDLLLIDDIQFISRSEYAQEEFFNTFNALYNLNHQIIIASDRLPDEIPKLAARLTSRFQGGVIVDVQPPDLEMRIAILRSKATEFGMALPDDVTAYIAETYRDNTRELEGALKRVVTAASLNSGGVTLEQVKALLGATRRELKRRITPRQVIEAVGKTFDVSLRELTGTKRRHEIVRARQVAMYVLRDRMQLQFERIAELLGGKDHSTIMYGVRVVEKTIESDVELQGKIEDVLELIGR